jgi:hypothetical protein
MTRLRFLVPTLLLLLLLAACGDDSGEPEVDAEQSARLDRALATLDSTSERVRREVLRTCDKWFQPDRPCVDNAIRIDQLDCWLEAGLRRWQFAQKKSMGPFGGDRVTMIAQNVCLQRRGWRRKHPEEQFEERF